MTIANLHDILHPAMAEQRAVAGVVVLGWEDATAYTMAAEEVGCPLILQAGPGARAHMPLPVIGPMLRHLAEQASVSVAVHLDHGYGKDECLAGLDYGFTSLMFDGSQLALDENIKITSQIAEVAHQHGASVEGEVGYVGYSHGAQSKGTEPEEAARYATESGADALAVSIGNVHLQTEAGDGIDFQRLAEIEAVTTLPLVLHGGSGIATPVRQKLACESRVCKFNIGTELRQIFGAALRKSLAEQPAEFDRNKLLGPIIEPLHAAAVEILTALHKPSG